jgi:hypothetical protein
VDQALGAAAGLMEAQEIALHFFVLAQGVNRSLKNGGGVGIRGHNQAIVHPFAFAAGGDYSGTAQVGEMAGDFGLGRPKDIHEITDTDFLASDQIDEAETRGIGQSLE